MKVNNSESAFVIKDERKKVKTLREIMSEDVYNACIHTTSHAIPNILRTNHLILKIFWLISFLVCLCLCLIHISLILRNFFSFPSYNTNSLGKELPIKFPMVTFCNINILNESNDFTIEYLKKFKPLLNQPFTEDTDLLVDTRIKEYLIRTEINTDKQLTNITIKALGY